MTMASTAALISIASLFFNFLWEHDAETSAEAAEAAKELSELLSKAAMERNKTDNDLVNLGNLVDQPNVEGRGQGQVVALVGNRRDEGLAAAFNAPSTEGAIMRTPG